MRKKFSPKQQRLIVAGCTVALVAAVAGIYVFRATHKTAAVVPKGPEAPQVTAASTGKGPASGTNSPTSQTGSAADQSKVNASLSEPSGQLNHKTVSKSASDQANNSPNLEATCLTAAGASCSVQVISPSGQAQTIAAGYSDGQGNFIFDWNAKGYANGSWQVNLVASKDGSTTSVDIGPLVVQP